MPGFTGLAPAADGHELNVSAALSFPAWILFAHAIEEDRDLEGVIYVPPAML